MMTILITAVLPVLAICTEALAYCSSSWSGFIQSGVFMVGATGPVAPLRTMEANVFELACMASFIGNVSVIQASKQLHCWAKCVQKSL